jgi:hypothetical protein
MIAEKGSHPYPAGVQLGNLIDLGAVMRRSPEALDDAQLQTD